MKIDIRIFIPFVTPFAMLILLRLMFWVAGAAWTMAAEAAIACTVFGLLFGCFIFAVLLEEKIEIGHFYIGKKP